MGYIISLITSLILIVIIIMRLYKSNVIGKCTEITKEIGKSYINIFKGNMFLKSGLYVMLLIFAVISTFIYTKILINNYMSFYSIKSYFIIEIIIIIFILLLVFYCIGYILLIFFRINNFVKKTEDRDFKLDLILSYFIISVYLVIMLIFTEEFKKLAGVVLISVSISYIINLRLIFKLMRNPIKVKSKKESAISFSRIIAASILILSMIILDLYLAACSIYSMIPNAYNSVSNYFSLFYYVIISFTTIGYGDIYPVSIASRILAIVISITSVVCLSIFISSILAYEEPINKFKK